MSNRVSTRACLSAPIFGLLFAFAVAPRPAAQQAAPSAKGPTAADKYMNIQVLKDLPAAELHDTMVFMAASVGGHCEFCHVRVPGGDIDFSKDDRDTKKTARKMIQMVRTINAQNFEGDPTVTCATCHQGRHEPSPFPPLAQALTPEQLARTRQAGPPARPTETADQVLDRFVQAIGGPDALQKITSRARRGSVTDRAGRTLPITVEDTSSGQIRVTVGAEPLFSRAFDGTEGWVQSGSNTRALEGVELLDVRLQEDLGAMAHARQRYGAFQARAYDTLDGHDVIVLTGRTSTEVNETLFFDRASGLLWRRVVRLRTPMGRLPVQIDYADYRTVDGVKMPFEVRIASWDSLAVEKFTDVALNPALAPARFAMPAAKGGE